MAEFTPINSQEELDRVIASRLTRERETITKQMQTQIDQEKAKAEAAEARAKELSTANETLKGQDAKVKELEVKLKGYETDSVKTRIALELGLPYGMAGRLQGEDEKAIRTDAEALKKMMGIEKSAPLRNPDSGSGDGDSTQWAKVAAQLKGE